VGIWEPRKGNLCNALKPANHKKKEVPLRRSKKGENHGESKPTPNGNRYRLEDHGTRKGEKRDDCSRVAQLGKIPSSGIRRGDERRKGSEGGGCWSLRWEKVTPEGQKKWKKQERGSGRKKKNTGQIRKLESPQRGRP